jgi:hypothetical protein
MRLKIAVSVVRFHPCFDWAGIAIAKPSAYQPLYHPAPECRLEQLAERVTVFVVPTATIGMHIAIPDKMWFSDHPYFPKTLERATPMAFRKGDRAASGPDRQWLRPAVFRRGPRPLSIAKQNRRPSPSFAQLRPFAALRVQVCSARRLRRHEGRNGRGRSDEEEPR